MDKPTLEGAHEALFRENTTAGDPFDVHSASVAAWRNVWAIVDYERARIATLEAELAEWQDHYAEMGCRANALRDALAGTFGVLAYYGKRPGEQGVNASPSKRAVIEARDAAEAAYNATPAASLAALKAEVLERAARAVVEGRSCKAQHPFNPAECEECHWFDGAANSVRALGGAK